MARREVAGHMPSDSDRRHWQAESIAENTFRNSKAFTRITKEAEKMLAGMDKTLRQEFVQTEKRAVRGRKGA